MGGWGGQLVTPKVSEHLHLPVCCTPILFPYSLPKAPTLPCPACTMSTRMVCCPVLHCAAPSATPPSTGNRWEAAVYGALCGHVARVLPACSSWEDEAWAYCRYVCAARQRE